MACGNFLIAPGCGARDNRRACALARACHSHIAARQRCPGGRSMITVLAPVSTISLTAILLAAPTIAAQSEPQQGTIYRSPGGTTLRLMLDETNVGKDVSLGEMIFPPNTD